MEGLRQLMYRSVSPGSIRKPDYAVQSQWRWERLYEYLMGSSIMGWIAIFVKPRLVLWWSTGSA